MYKELAFCTGRSKDVGPDWVELDSLNRTSMLVDLLNKSVAVDIQ
jgi:hypothetical protein